MTVTEDPEFVAETLAWCNRIRAEKGQEPLSRLPKGERNDALSCPCGRATGVYVDSLTWGPDHDHRNDNVLPDAVSDFVVAFDHGRLPQYDENPEFEDELEDDPV